MRRAARVHGDRATHEMTDEAPDLNAATVSLTAFTPFIRLLEEAGQEDPHAAERAQRSCARWGMPFAELEFDPTLRLPHGLVVELLLDSSRSSAIRRRRCAPVSSCSRRLRVARVPVRQLRDLGRVDRVPGPLLPTVDRRRERAVDRGRPRRGAPPHRAGLEAPDAMHEFGLASNFAMTAMHLQLEDAQCRSRCVSRTAARLRRAVPAVLLAPVRFECEHNAIVFPVSMLDPPDAHR